MCSLMKRLSRSCAQTPRHQFDVDMLNNDNLNAHGRPATLTIFPDRILLATNGIAHTHRHILLHFMCACSYPDGSSFSWELKYIRRFGFDNHFFSFETSRKAASGAGVWSFRTTRAKEAYELLDDLLAQTTNSIGATADDLSIIRSSDAMHGALKKSDYDPYLAHSASSDEGGLTGLSTSGSGPQSFQSERSVHAV
eukprot:m.172866 g.172866  ORF g.172866 m.172866 type:complete len:196 (-) comp9950_c2_seq15:6932-7519(-)